MKKSVLFLFLFSVLGFSQSVTKTISGRVTDGKNPLNNTAINVANTTKSTFSDQAGKYTITASPGDILQYSFQGMKTVKIRVEDVTRILNIEMVPDIEELEEVTVASSRRKSQRELSLEFPDNKNIIRTAWGFLDADRAAGNIRILSEDQINPISYCILDLLRNRFPGVFVTGSCITGTRTPDPGTITEDRLQVGGQVRIRPGNSLTSALPAVFDIDGQLFTDVPIWLDVNNIKRIAILPNLATTAPYGNLGAGGVVVINTIIASPKREEIYDRARLRNNFVSENIATQEKLRRNWPTYLKELYASSSFEEARTVYENYAANYSGSPYFVLDTQHYFSSRWNEKAFADEIVAGAEVMFQKNPVLLKALAYQYEEQGAYEKANECYKKVLKLRPNYAQSYLDMANSYRDLKNPKQAAAIYTRYDHLLEQGLMKTDTTGFGPIFDREYNNFLLLNKNAVVQGQNARELYIAEEDFEGTRLVFEWNDSEAEFDLQFVNPEKQFFLWKHTIASNAELVTQEKDFGYSTTEYLLDEALPGAWTVNVNYYGNKSLTPTYLKATVYYNYGSYAQRKETKVYKLSLKGVPQELFTVSVAGKLVSR